MCSGPDFSRDSAGGAEERNAPQPEGIDGPRRAQRLLRFLHLVSTMALMKGLHQKKTKRKQALEDLTLNPPEILRDSMSRPCSGRTSGFTYFSPSPRGEGVGG